jgi:hypothetical protein
MLTLQQRPLEFADPTLVRSDMDTASPIAHEAPLLVLDPGLIPNAGEFLARCRRCGWSSTRESTPDKALAAFAAHSCHERPA